MKKRFAALCVAGSVGFGTSAAAQEAAAPPRYVQAADMTDFATGAILPGAGVLSRDESGVSASLSMTGLLPNAAYTAWWAVFNRPDRCTLPCSIDDVIAGIGQSFYAAGYIADGEGVANISARLLRGPIPIGADRLSDNNPAVDPAGEVGLKNPYKAEIHVVAARVHGPLVVGRVDEQLSTFGGGCDLFACANRQVVQFAPVK